MENNCPRPKREWGGGGGIVSVEVAWKVCATMLTCCLKRGVVLHDTQHRFREVWGTGTDTMEANLS